jgi:hypothetical protein
MVHVNGARNALRDKAQSDIDEAAVGTDGSSESVTDTSIGNEILSKSEGNGLTESDDGDGGSLWEFTVSLSEANGNELKEVVLRASGTATLWVRITHSGVLKENDFELDYEISTSYDNA